MNKIDTAIILAGGKGSRLIEVQPNTPKALTQINGITVLERIINQILKTEIKNIIVSVLFMSEEIDLFLKEKDFSSRHVYTMKEKTALGTGGAIKNILLNTQTESALVLNGDTLNNFDINSIITTHNSKKHENTIGISAKENDRDYGEVNIEDGYLRSFSEKEDKGFQYTNAGIYILHTELFNHTHKSSFSLERDLFPLAAKHEIGVHIFEGKFWDIGTPERLKVAIKEIK